MKLKSCYITGFGKFKDTEFDLSKSVVEIYAENGYGKSTLANFIKCMFFGLDGGRVKSVEGNERLKYQPFHGGAFGGRLTFEAKGKTYRIERSFGKAPNMDECKIYDENNAQSLDFGADCSKVGEVLFKVDGESFKNSAYIPQGEIPINGLPDTMKNRLLALLTASQEGGEDAMEKLEKAERELRAKRRPAKGKLDILDERLEELYRKKEENNGYLRSAKESESKLSQADEEIKKIQAQTDKIAAEIEERTQKGDLRQHRQALADAHKNVEKAQSALNELKVFFGDVPPANIEYVSLEKAISDYYLQKQALLRQEEDLLKEKQEKLALERKISKRKKGKILLWVMTAIWAVFGGVAILKSLFVWGVAAFVLSVGCILGAVLLSKTPKNNKGETLKIKEKEIENGWQEVARLERGILVFFEKFPTLKGKECSLALIRLKEKLSEYERAYKLYEEGKKQLSLLNKRDVEGEERIIARLKQEKEEWERQKEIWIFYRAQLVERIESLKRRGDCSSLLLEEEGINEEKARLEKCLLAVRTAKEILGKVKENMASRYLQTVEENCRKYLQITGAGTRSLRYTPNGEPVLDENGKTVGMGYFSEGEKETVGFCTRLALADALFTEEKPPLILDDPFVNFDDEKTEKAKALVKEISKEYQVMYFTCKRVLCVD